MLAKKAEKACKDYAVHSSIYCSFCNHLTTENINTWTIEVEAYENNLSLPDPYYCKIPDVYFLCFCLCLY